jgi:WD40 repeat protein
MDLLDCIDAAVVGDAGILSPLQRPLLTRGVGCCIALAMFVDRDNRFTHVSRASLFSSCNNLDTKRPCRELWHSTGFVGSGSHCFHMEFFSTKPDNRTTMSFETEAADIPALEIHNELVLHVAKDMRRKRTATGRHGPCVSRDNPIVSMVHDQHQQRIYVGMQLGEVMFWDLKRPKTKDTEALYNQHSSHKLVGRHEVSPYHLFSFQQDSAQRNTVWLTSERHCLLQGAVTSLCCLRPTAHFMMPLIVTGSADRCIKLWDPRRGNPIEPSILIQTLYRHAGTVTALVSCSDQIISGSTDRTVRLWRCADGCRALMYPPLEQVRLRTAR